MTKAAKKPVKAAKPTVKKKRAVKPQEVVQRSTVIVPTVYAVPVVSDVLPDNRPYIIDGSSKKTPKRSFFHRLFFGG